jgi:hypothetical protein
MQIRLIIAQYKQSYPGEYMPNVVDAWDEYVLEDNWQGYEEALAKHKAGEGTDYEPNGVKELIVTVPDDVITGLFDIPVVEAQVR